MIGEINGHTINGSVPIDGIGPANRYELMGFIDSIVDPLVMVINLQVEGFIDSALDALVMWDGTIETCSLTIDDPCTILVSQRDTCGDSGC